MKIAIAQAKVVKGEGYYLGANIDFYWKPKDIWREPKWSFLVDIYIIKINLCLELHGKYLENE